MNRPQTTWAASLHPVTGAPITAPITKKGLDPNTGKIPLREVPIPSRPRQRKGRTKYDEEFDRMLEGKSAIQVHESNLPAMRRAIKRFLMFRNLTKQIAVRQQIDPTARMVALWLEPKEPI